MNILVKAKALNLPANSYCVVGSGVLEIHGIRTAKDLDILVNRESYQELKKRGWKRHWFFWRVLTCKALKNGDNEAFSNFKCGKNYRLETDEILKKSEFFEGVPFLPLLDLLIIKKEFAKKRAKDARDVELIVSYLQNQRV